MLTARSIGHPNFENTTRDNKLNVIFYARNEETLNAARTAIAERIPGARVEFCRNLVALSERLRKPSYESTVLVILVADKGDLEDISSLKQFLWELRIILVLPDGDDATIALAHSLRPRLVSKYGDDLENVMAVLNKMIDDYNSKSKTQ